MSEDRQPEPEEPFGHLPSDWNERLEQQGVGRDLTDDECLAPPAGWLPLESGVAGGPTAVLPSTSRSPAPPSDSELADLDVESGG